MAEQLESKEVFQPIQMSDLCRQTEQLFDKREVYEEQDSKQVFGLYEACREVVGNLVKERDYDIFRLAGELGKQTTLEPEDLPCLSESGLAVDMETQFTQIAEDILYGETEKHFPEKDFAKIRKERARKHSLP